MLRALHLEPDQENYLKVEILSKLPRLPSVIRYYDQFDEKQRSIPNFSTSMSIETLCNGSTHAANLARFSPNLAELLRHVLAQQILRNVGVAAATQRAVSVAHLSSDELSRVVRATPESAARVWSILRGTQRPARTLELVKEIFRLFCRHLLNGWNPSYTNFIHDALPLPFVDKYAFIKAGKGVLSTSQEASIVWHIDDAVLSIGQCASSWTRESLSDLAMLMCAYQFGLRPVQIARLKVEDCRCIEVSGAESLAVHLSFPMVKQRHDSKTLPLVRRVKSEWCPVFIEMSNRVKAIGIKRDSRIFDVESAREAAVRITRLAQRILDTPEISAKTFRHAAAQRMVDAGASHEELAAFLGHSDITSGMVYFRTSSSHADRINRAFGISEVYSKLAKIAHERFIDDDELVRLKGDQQIGAVPHGIAIAGIGGCSSGQSACPYNPVLSCYGCRRFMPLHTADIHREVLANLRTVVAFFASQGREEPETPAFLQLQRTISNVQSIISEIEGGWGE
jgi:integrase